MKPNGLVDVGVDRRPDVDAEVAGEHRQLVHQRDVDVAEGVLEELDQLRLGGGPDRHDLVDEAAVEGLDRAERVGVDARHDLGRVAEAPRGVAGVDALGRVAEEEVVAGAKATAPLEDRPHELFGGAGIGRRLEHDERAGAKVARDHVSAAASMNERSGAPSRSGVGTVMTATSKSAMSAGSSVAT